MDGQGGLLPAAGKKVPCMSSSEISPPPRAPLQVRPLGLRDALRWLGIALLVVASLVVIGAFLLMPVVPAGAASLG